MVSFGIASSIWSTDYVTMCRISCACVPWRICTLEIVCHNIYTSSFGIAPKIPNAVEWNSIAVQLKGFETIRVSCNRTPLARWWAVWGASALLLIFLDDLLVEQLLKKLVLALKSEYRECCVRGAARSPDSKISFCKLYSSLAIVFDSVAIGNLMNRLRCLSDWDLL